MPDVMAEVVALLSLIVIIIQSTGNYLAAKADKR